MTTNLEQLIEEDEDVINDYLYETEVIDFINDVKELMKKIKTKKLLYKI